MSKIDKLIQKMRNNQLNWTIDDIKSIADRFAIEYRQPGTSHVTFRCKRSACKVTIPAHKPIKPIYVKQFLMLLDELRGQNE